MLEDQTLQACLQQAINVRMSWRFCLQELCSEAERRRKLTALVYSQWTQGGKVGAYSITVPCHHKSCKGHTALSACRVREAFAQWTVLHKMRECGTECKAHRVGSALSEHCRMSAG